MNQIIKFIPLATFFLLYQIYDIYIATAALVLSSTIQLILTYILGNLEKIEIITVILIIIFGSMTFFLRDANFIKWKVTAIYLILSIYLTVTHILGQSVIKSMLEKEFTLPDYAWNKLNWGWVSFFLSSAILNIYIAYNYSLNIWVNFKVFGLLAGTLICMLLTSIYIYKNLESGKG
ncbi:intracellular septation protein [Candidatus Photodesmus katoptron]|uniref:septation protein A n=1 Tax=Candidatus Photodesmus anomalopis TaxID=28176 RepID=UPI0004D7B05D|nr:septation protein A [Candidatus Photodesmus katoptron]KEY90708.1 intracellular septation protein [Candidatus Photodesmus katoptron]